MHQRLAVWMTVAAAAFTIACGGEKPAPESSAAPATPPAPKPPTAAERVAWYQDCWGLFNSKTWDRFSACYATDADSDAVDSGQPLAKGPDAIVAAAKPFTTAFPDVTGTPQLILVNGDNIASLYLLKGTHTGPLEGAGEKPLPATNKPISVYFGHAIEMDPDTNKVVHEWGFNENGTLMAQLGVSKAPARPATTEGLSSPTIVMASGSDTEAKNVEAFRAQIELFSKHDLAATVAYNAPDAVFHDLTQPKDTDSKGNATSLGEFMKAFPDARISVTSIWGAGDWVSARGVFEGTNKGAAPSMGIRKPTGKPVQVHYLEFTKYANGKIVEDWLIFDTMAFARQLGLLGS